MSADGLPPYSVRESTRARHIRLTVTPREGLVVVVPAGARVDAAQVVASKRRWAERSLARVAEKRAQYLGGSAVLLPDHVCLPLAGVDGAVVYRMTASKRCSVSAHLGALVVSGPDDDDQRLEALSRWLDREARNHLPVLLDAVAVREEITYGRCRITKARSRWGSCSSRQTISLNRNVMFFPTHLADALVLHELAHLRHMNHSPHFWAYLAKLDPDALHNRVALKGVGTVVPAWADA